MANRLAQATSPYLLGHADNPVDWWTWSEEAFAEARRRDVPVLLSVGYSSCHWCHVMAHESFEDQATADEMNAHFVSIKVDREERPDVDAVYMEAVQAATGQGGWPMTVFLTPDAEPFYFGTYFPPAPRHGMPSFRQVLEGVAQAWAERRDEVGEVAGKITRDLAGRELSVGGDEVPGEQELAQALLGLTREYDAQRGGFGGAPKFPPSMVLEFLLRHHARTGAEGALQMAADTCERMARGGIYDQLGGGFARYSVDRDWVVPHFEKMLYDNALLCRVYTRLWRTTGSELARRVALETADFMVRELRTPNPTSPAMIKATITVHSSRSPFQAPGRAGPARRRGRRIRGTSKDAVQDRPEGSGGRRAHRVGWIHGRTTPEPAPLDGAVVLAALWAGCCGARSGWASGRTRPGRAVRGRSALRVPRGGTAGCELRRRRPGAPRCRGHVALARHLVTQGTRDVASTAPMDRQEQVLERHPRPRRLHQLRLQRQRLRLAVQLQAERRQL
ncbi:hypothetical protein STENM223S_06977 [Streptomyces tendae]